MLVYGNRSRTIEPRRALAGIGGLLASRSADRTTQALIEAGELAQGLADMELEAKAQDDESDLQSAAMALTTAIAHRLVHRNAPDRTVPAIQLLRAQPLPPTVRRRTPEGYAFYAVYPAAYARAAAEQDWAAPPLVIGIRSIGTSLAAVVAAATGGSAITVRPTGPPFQRRVQVSARLSARLKAHTGPFVIVDEGPGLSGSSFGCVADLLVDLGIPEGRITFMPSHGGGLGPHASAAHRARWDRARRVVRTLDDLIAHDPLPAWFEADVGRALAVTDLSAGAWRREWPGAAPPPALPALERRKVRFRTSSGVYVARFAGLGRVGEAKLQRALALHAAGFAPEPVALRNGFLLERWVEGGPLDAASERSGFLRRLGDYLALRAEQFPAAAEEGADAPALREMAITNAAELCGPTTADRVGAVLRNMARVAPARPVHVDGRLHAWEWRGGGHAIVKLDALDHSCGHDLIGAQDIAWDIAGAAVEFGLTAEEARALAVRVAVPAAGLRPMIACYAAFQGGLWSSGTGSAEHGAHQRVGFYAGVLERLAASDS